MILQRTESPDHPLTWCWYFYQLHAAAWAFNFQELLFLSVQIAGQVAWIATLSVWASLPDSLNSDFILNHNWISEVLIFKWCSKMEHEGWNHHSSHLQTFYWAFGSWGNEWFLLCVTPQTLQDLAVPSVDLSSVHSQHEIRQLYLQPEVFYYLIYFLQFFPNTDNNAATEFFQLSIQE